MSPTNSTWFLYSADVNKDELAGLHLSPGDAATTKHYGSKQKKTAIVQLLSQERGSERSLRAKRVVRSK